VLDSERWLVSRGLRVMDAPWVLLNAQDATLSSPGPPLSRSLAVEARAQRMGLWHREDQAAPSGTFAIASWALPEGATSLAARATHAAAQVLDRERLDGASLIPQLAGLLRTVQIAPSTSTDRRALLADLTDG
jgi:hypothetical protein